MSLRAEAIRGRGVAISSFIPPQRFFAFGSEWPRVYHPERNEGSRIFNV